MRIFCLFPLLLPVSGCATVQTSSTTKPPALPRVVLYTRAEALAGKTVDNAGDSCGKDCQHSPCRAVAGIAVARQQLKIHAAALRVFAVLVHQCPTVSGIAGGYRQAVCQGKALNIDK